MQRTKSQAAFRRTRRALCALLAVGIVLLLPGGAPLAPVPVAHAQASFNYAEALQKAIFFYEEQISGPKPAFSRVTCPDCVVSKPNGWSTLPLAAGNDSSVIQIGRLPSP